MNFVKLSLPISENEVRDLIILEEKEIAVSEKNTLERVVSDQKQRRLNATNDFSDSQKLEFYQIYGQLKKDHQTSEKGSQKKEVVYAEPAYTPFPKIEMQSQAVKHGFFRSLTSSRIANGLIVLSVVVFLFYQWNLRKESREYSSKVEDRTLSDRQAATQVDAINADHLNSKVLEIEVIEKGTPVYVPSDSGATYLILSKNKTDDGVELLSKRTGSSGVSYSLILFDCNGDYKYLGEGDTRVAAEAKVNPSPNMAPIDSGSIKSYQQAHACS